MKVYKEWKKVRIQVWVNRGRVHDEKCEGNNQWISVLRSDSKHHYYVLQGGCTWDLFTGNIFLLKLYWIQESIPVGCIPPACWPYPVVSGGSQPNPLDADPPSRCRPPPPSKGRPPPWTEWLTHACENITFLAGGKYLSICVRVKITPEELLIVHPNIKCLAGRFSHLDSHILPDYSDLNNHSTISHNVKKPLALTISFHHHCPWS